jgi:hypothetical protein
VNNPIPHSNLFVTESLTQVFERIESFSNKKERAQAYQVAMLVLNACHMAVQKELDAETV